MDTLKEKSLTDAPCRWQTVTTVFTKQSSFLLIGSYTVYICIFFIYKYLPYIWWQSVHQLTCRFKDRWDRMLYYMKRLLPGIGWGAVVSRWPGSPGCPPQSWRGCRDPEPAAPWGEAPGEGRGGEEVSNSSNMYHYDEVPPSLVSVQVVLLCGKSCRNTFFYIPVEWRISKSLICPDFVSEMQLIHL